jgi:hypothetical protein
MLYIVVDENNLIVDIASLEVHLCVERVEAKNNVIYQVETDTSIFVGDEYDPINRTIIKRPENYPKPSTAILAEIQIQAEMRRLAVANLKTKGTLPIDFVDSQAVAEIPILTEEP